ncbi:MAG TPA: type II toxin-antitoxin system VapC family toxin [Jatrophihabitans sp.]|uniref:type II toxin-antitoxin system VapC family toxin n=1 Tax=Jatrophihabitans sp. TaxID=1932789 RepID=UPI002F1635CB
MIYADTSALAKLVIAEAETPALREWISRQDARLVTNVIGVVELRRLTARISRQALDTATLLLGRIDRIALTPAALALAGQLPPPEVRTLDAVHIASAAELLELQAVLTYDRRMADAAIGYGLPVESPR